jgi:hypothetical protein
MEYRQLAALILALVVIAGLAITYFYLTREWRAQRRAHRRADLRRRVRARQG